MRVVVIGGTGHIGSYLVPRLAELGHRVLCVSRGLREAYAPHSAWKSVEMVILDRDKAESGGDFGARIGGLEGDVVIDLTCFTLKSAGLLVEALRGKVQHFLHCGTIWVHGPSVRVPTMEEEPRRPFGAYGIQKAQVEEYLLKEARLEGFPATIIHPGHIVGPGWVPLNPAGHFNPEAFVQLALGRPFTLPNFGLETVHHVHADDVAQAFVGALNHRSVAIGESFHAVSPAALTLRGYAESIAAWFGKTADLRFLPWERWRETVGVEEAKATYDHIAHSPNCSIAKAGSLLDFQPRYTTLQAVTEALSWMIANGTITV